MVVDWTVFTKEPPPGPGFYLVTCVWQDDVDNNQPYENAHVQVSFWDGEEWGDDGGHESIVVAWAEAPLPYKG